MTIQVRAFASAREALGAGTTVLALPDGATVAAAWQALGERWPKLRDVPLQAFAVNRAYVPTDTALREGDELVLIPPVSGG